MRHSHVFVVAAAFAAAFVGQSRPVAAQSLALATSGSQAACSTCASLATATLNTNPNLGDWALAAAPASSKDDAWHFTLVPYLLIPSLSGTTGIGALPPVKLSVSASQLFSAFQIGGMLYFEASKGPWSFALDGIYVDLKQNITPDVAHLSGSASLTEGILEGFVFYRVAKPLEVMIGGIGAHLTGSITATLAVGDSDQVVKQKTGSNGEAWGDPVVGARWTPLDEEHWHVMLFGDIGAISGSNWTWQVVPAVGYRFSKLFELGLQYRALALNYTSSGAYAFKYDVTMYGPELSFAFHF